MHDSLYVPIVIGDTVTVTAWGNGARLIDVRRSGIVTAFGRTRVVVSFPRDCIDDAGTRNLDPTVVTVNRRDGAPGWEGNRA